MNSFLEEIHSEPMEKWNGDEVENNIEQEFESDKGFFWSDSKVETLSEVAERLHELGIENVDLTGAKEIWQKKYCHLLKQ